MLGMHQHNLVHFNNTQMMHIRIIMENAVEYIHEKMYHSGTKELDVCDTMESSVDVQL